MKKNSLWRFAAVALAFAAPSSFALDAFVLPWMNAEETPSMYRSAEHPNAVFVVEAYFLNCPYCNDNAPNVDRLASHFQGNDRVQVLDVGIDRNDSQYAEWIRRHKPNHPVLKDANRVVIKQLGTTGYPSTYVVDCKGNVVYTATGVWSSSRLTTLIAKVEGALATTCQ